MENGTIENLEELDKLCQILKDKNSETTKIGEDQDILREHLKP